MTYNISEIDFTTKSQALQLKLNLNTEVYVKDNGKVLLVQNIMERMGLKEVLKLYLYFKNINHITIINNIGVITKSAIIK